VVGFIVGGVCYGGAVDVLTLLLVVKIGSSRSRSCGRCRQKCCCFALKKCVRLVQEKMSNSLSLVLAFFWWPFLSGLNFESFFLAEESCAAAAEKNLLLPKP